MTERTLWHPVAQSSDVVSAPFSVLLLEQPLVLWRNAEGLVQSFVDRCPIVVHACPWGVWKTGIWNALITAGNSHREANA